MDIDLSEDQQMIMRGAAAITDRYLELPHSAGYYIQSKELERDLIEGGFIAPKSGLSALDSLLIVEAVARSAFVVEAAVSLLVAGMLPEGDTLPRPLAITESLDRPIRFLQPGGTLLFVSDCEVRAFSVSEDAVDPVHTPFAYPYGRLRRVDPASGQVLLVDPAAVRHWWRVAIAAEIAAAGRAALDLTVEYVSARVQFGRPIGSFQAVQHRLAVCSMLVEATEIATRRAAATGDPLDAAAAAAIAQDAAGNLHYECAQFHGAMGLTLETPLHYFTYRLKALQGELGGLPAQATMVADYQWPNN